MSPNLYAPPSATLADAEGSESAPPLWNPNAAANWSLMFSPVFGAYLHMKNWQALGEEDKAKSAKSWMIASLVVSLGLPLAALLDPTGLGRGTRFVGFALLLAWYASSAKRQVGFVKARFGKHYPRKGWTQPLLMGLAAIVGYFALWAMIGAMFFRS